MKVQEEIQITIFACMLMVTEAYILWGKCLTKEGSEASFSPALKGRFLERLGKPNNGAIPFNIIPSPLRNRIGGLCDKRNLLLYTS